MIPPHQLWLLQLPNKCDSDSDGRVFALFLNFTSLISFSSKLSATECLDVQRFVCGSISGTQNATRDSGGWERHLDSPSLLLQFIDGKTEAQGEDEVCSRSLGDRQAKLELCRTTQVKGKHDLINDASTNSVPHLFIRTHSFMHSFIHSLVHAFIHPFMHSCVHPFIHTCVHSFAHIHSFMHSFIHSCLHLYTCIHSFIHARIHSFMQARIHSFVRSTVWRARLPRVGLWTKIGI